MLCPWKSKYHTRVHTSNKKHRGRTLLKVFIWVGGGRRLENGVCVCVGGGGAWGPKDKSKSPPTFFLVLWGALGCFLVLWSALGVLWGAFWCFGVLWVALGCFGGD